MLNALKARLLALVLIVGVADASAALAVPSGSGRLVGETFGAEAGVLCDMTSVIAVGGSRTRGCYSEIVPTWLTTMEGQSAITAYDPQTVWLETHAIYRTSPGPNATRVQSTASTQLTFLFELQGAAPTGDLSVLNSLSVQTDVGYSHSRGTSHAQIWSGGSLIWEASSDLCLPGSPSSCLGSNWFEQKAATLTLSTNTVYEVRLESTSLASEACLPGTAHPCQTFMAIGTHSYASFAIDSATPGVTLVTALPVPEPATWMFMVFGLAFVASMTRRSRRC